MNTKRWLALVAAIVLLFVSIGFRFTMNIASGLLEGFASLDEYYYSEEVVVEGDWDERIAVLNLNGVIMDQELSLFMEGYDHNKFLNMIDQASEDESVKAIILRVDSPGGEVGATAQIHEKLVELKENYSKPIYISMGSTAASGGYYVAAPADKIFAETSTLTGSIGVIMENINYSELAENYGVHFNTIKSGKHKDIMSPSREMTKEEREILQSIIDEMYDDFVQVIVDGRGMSEAKVREVGDGRIYTGRQAKEVGLVDELGDFDDALAAIQKDYNLEDAQVIQYGEDFVFLSGFVTQMKNVFQGNTSELELVMSLVRQSDKPRAMYIY
ncbi:signal peptide peptidase SppA [Pseudogracilibacillus sp. SE30717A]|uniref:signal peptide peptidase SppA n=1 Tax=Pseudogracilibacillus sp. SE30717A TaxID=3098293 RepID=UPI00300DFC39